MSYLTNLSTTQPGSLSRLGGGADPGEAWAHGLWEKKYQIDETSLILSNVLEQVPGC